jgi:hypothetical protein
MNKYRELILPNQRAPLVKTSSGVYGSILKNHKGKTVFMIEDLIACNISIDWSDPFGNMKDLGNRKIQIKDIMPMHEDCTIRYVNLDYLIDYTESRKCDPINIVGIPDITFFENDPYFQKPSVGIRSFSSRSNDSILVYLYNEMKILYLLDLGSKILLIYQLSRYPNYVFGIFVNLETKKPEKAIVVEGDAYFISNIPVDLSLSPGKYLEARSGKTVLFPFIERAVSRRFYEIVLDDNGDEMENIPIILLEKRLLQDRDITNSSVHLGQDGILFVLEELAVFFPYSYYRVAILENISLVEPVSRFGSFLDETDEFSFSELTDSVILYTNH